MGNLVQNCIENVLPLVAGVLLIALDVLITVNDATNIFHGAHVVVWHKNLVEFTEGIGSAENLLIKMDSIFADSEPVLTHFLYILGK